MAAQELRKGTESRVERLLPFQSRGRLRRSRQICQTRSFALAMSFTRVESIHTFVLRHKTWIEQLRRSAGFLLMVL